MTELAKIIEAILFVSGEPVPLGAVARALEVTELEVSAAADELAALLTGCGFSDASVEELFTLPRMAEGYTDLAQQLDGLLNSLSGGGEVQSFTSTENTEVSAVQFALQTVAIEAPEAEAEPEAAPVVLNFWQKLLKLFGLYKV